jgi:ubiquinone/menaquinone biosynthesis C-methylase UbiE
MMATPHGEWEPEADNWLRWARTPGFDAYWHFRDSFFESILPARGRRTLEIGCGEGRVARDLTARGHSVVAVDTAETLVRAAITADDEGEYAAADGRALPFPDRCFDIVVAYNALQVVGDMPATVAEAARVLSAGGCLCACIAHPVTDLGNFTGDGTDARFSIRSDYFARRRVEQTEHSEGHTMTFRGWTYSLEHYSLALEAAGFRIEAMREPVPALTADKYRRWRDIPLFLNFRAIKI